MKKDSNTYIFIYSAVLVIVAAVLLSTANIFLKPYQDRNVRTEKMRNILVAAKVGTDDIKDVERLFADKCKNMLVVDQDGVVSEDENAFGIDLKEQLYRKSKGLDYVLPVFVIENEGKTMSVIPLQGNGLWGPIWGYLALASDGNTIVGTVFDHKSETPGLGGEIVKPQFASQFEGKTVFEDGRLVSVRVVKGGVKNMPIAERKHAVDAISGATITSTGVNDMIENMLNLYSDYLNKLADTEMN